MLRNGGTKPAQNECCSLVVLVPKPDEFWRVCIDFRWHEGIIIRDTYSIPGRDDFVDSLGEATWFLTLEANLGYQQVPIVEEDQGRTMLTCQSGTYRLQRMPFDLINAPATFQRLLDILLGGLNCLRGLMYWNNVIVFSKSFGTHIKDADMVPSTLRKAIVFLIEKKLFFTYRVNYLIIIFMSRALAIDRASARSLHQLQHLRNVIKLQSILGLYNLTWRFFSHYRDIAAPLTKFLKKGQTKHFSTLGDHDIQDYNTLHRTILSKPVLAFKSPDLPFVIDTDASDYNVREALFHVYLDGERVPIKTVDPVTQLTLEELLSREKRAPSSCVGDANPPPLHSGVTFHLVLHPSVVTIAPGDIPAKSYTHALAYAP